MAIEGLERLSVCAAVNRLLGGPWTLAIPCFGCTFLIACIAILLKAI
jgi:hypothetical protein